MTDAPPKPSHAGPLLATTVLLLLWIAGTCAAPWLAPRVAWIAENVEVGLGLDILPGPQKSQSSGKAP